MKISITNLGWMSAALVAGMGSVAHAAETDLEVKGSAAGPAPASGIEIAISAGYSQGFGNVAAGAPALGDIASAGGVVELDIGYRLIPNLTLGVYGAGGSFTQRVSWYGTSLSQPNAISDTHYSVAAGVHANWHFLPDGVFDPWVGLGTGWRGYWTSTDSVGTTSRHGLELGRLQAGVDYRASETVAISPVIGADLSMFLTEQTAGQDTWHNVASPQLSTFVYAALLARFDLPTL